MKGKLINSFIIFILFSSIVAKAQNNAVKWTAYKPFEQNVFIENKGQFSKQELQDVGGNIIYSTFKGKLHVYFLDNGIVYRYDSLYLDKGLDSEADKDIDEVRKHTKIKHVFTRMFWAGANNDAVLKVDNQVSNYYTYGNPDDATGSTGIICHAWHTLTYSNIYNGVDIVFEYPDEGGLKYKIVVHKGGDMALVKMQYSADTKIEIKNDNAILKTAVGNFIDRAPTAVDAHNNKIPISFNAIGKNLAFNVGTYNSKEDLVIDPWITSPNFVGNPNAYDIDCDRQNNVYAYGGQYPYQIVKLDLGGKVVWTYTSTFTYSYSPNYSYYGGLAVDGLTGTSFIAEGFDFTNGAQVLKVDAAGVQSGLNVGTSSFQEIWRMDFDDYTKTGVVMGGGTSSPSYEVGTLDTNLVNMNLGYLYNSSVHLDFSLLGMDKSGNSYIVSNLVGANDVLIKTPNVTPNKPVYTNTTASLSFAEIGGYYNGGNGLNGIALSPTDIFVYEDSVLQKYDKATGVFIKQVSVPATLNFSDGLAYTDCNQLYLGSHDTVIQFDTSLNRIGSMVMPDSIFCIKASDNGYVYASGSGFVTLFDTCNVKFIPPPIAENCDTTFVIPNVFTPNGDHQNDDFYIPATKMSTYHIDIFNRWGDKVYESSNASQPWNGKINNTGAAVADGVYYYIITASCGRTNYNRHGFVQVLK